MPGIEIPPEVQAELATSQDIPDAVKLAFARSEYWKCVNAALESYDLVEQFDRLHKTDLLGKASSIEREIDRVTGKQESDVLQFLIFVHECVYSRIPPETWEVPGVMVRGVRPTAT